LYEVQTLLPAFKISYCSKVPHCAEENTLNKQCLPKKKGQMKILIKTYIRRIFTPQFHSDWVGGDRRHRIVDCGAGDRLRKDALRNYKNSHIYIENGFNNKILYTCIGLKLYTL
jgi:hypothetical protein